MNKAMTWDELTEGLVRKPSRQKPRRQALMSLDAALLLLEGMDLPADEERVLLAYFEDEWHTYGVIMIPPPETEKERPAPRQLRRHRRQR